MDMEKTMQNLRERGFAVSRFATGAQARDYVCGQLHGRTIGLGGSQTLESLGIYEALCGDNEVFWHWKNKTPDTAEKGTAAQVYITSANAVAQTGEIINIDGRGNRVAGMLFDKEEVYIIVGVNKLAEDFDKALWRARNVAAPKNAMRLGMNTPCAKHGDRCYDCRSVERICNGLVVLWGPMMGMKKVEVVLVDEELGA